MNGGKKMSNVKIDNAIDLTYPEGFKEMSDEELTRYFGTPANRWGAHHADRHIILSVGWSKAGFLQSDAEMFLHKVEASTRLGLRNYQRISSFKTKIGSKKAFGIRFEYRVNDARIVQVADVIAFKYKKNFYTIHYVTRKSTAAEDRHAFQEILQSSALS